MGRMVTFMLIMSGMLLLFHFAGFIDKGVNTTLLNLLLEPESIKETTLNDNLLLALEGVALVGLIALGTVLGRGTEIAVMGTFSIFMFNLGMDFFNVFLKIKESNPALAILFFAPFMLIFIVTIIDFWRGRD